MAKPKKAGKRAAKAKANRHSRATWDGLFGRSEALVRGEIAFREAARPPAMAAAAVPVAGAGEVEALFGIWWTDPTFPIFYDIIVNNQPVPPPNSSRTGEVIRRVMLRRGRLNSVRWTIQHMGQGWKHRVFLKFDGQVIPLESAEDASTGDSDDLTSGSKTIDVPA